MLLGMRHRPLPLLPWLLLAACQTTPPLPAALADAVAALGPDTTTALWCGSPGKSPQIVLQQDAELPCASSIKAAFLVELFTAHADALDAPLPGADAVLADDQHPAIAHFAAAFRANARRDLTGQSVRRIGEAMISGKGVDNPTYNIAANLVIAHFGGPSAMTARLHARRPAWHGLQVRRYMLADRTVHGDNTATARSLAAVHAGLATGELPGVPAAARDAACAVLRVADGNGAERFRKGGALDSDPVTRVEAGWTADATGVRVHVVILQQAGVAAADRQAAGTRFGAAARALETHLLAQPH